jgi:hypothetical protein
MTLAVVGRARTQLVWDLARLAAVVGALSLARRHGWPATSAIILYSCVAATAMLALYGINAWHVLRAERDPSAAAAA